MSTEVFTTSVVLSSCNISDIDYVSDDTSVDHNEACVGENINDWSLLNVGCSESRFLLNLCTCNNKESLWCFVHDNVNEKQIYCVKKNNDFGFVCNMYPPVPLFRPGSELCCIDQVQWAFEADITVAQSNCPNYQGARIKVPTDLKIDNWRALCANFEDQLILEYLEYGFPLCIDKQTLNYNTDVHNHPSATQFPSDIDAYFEKEVKHKALVGPCKNIPFPVHYSPLLSRPKPNDTRRVIVNLSSPYGDSVNDHIENGWYDGASYELKYPSLDNIVNAVDELGPDVLLSKIDVSRAFRNLRVDPYDFDVLGLNWRGMTYLDISIPMGLKTGSALCQRTTDVLRHVMASRDVRVYNYIDDVICVHKRQKADAEFETLFSLFEFLGIPINPSKVVPPSKSLTCMGINVNLETKQLTIPQEKLLEILDMCRMYANKKFITKKQLQSLLGKLLYLHRCVPPARIFVNRLLNTLRKASTRIIMDSKMKKDIAWFESFLIQFNGKVMFQHGRLEVPVFVDASLSGMGAWWDGHAYAVSRHIPATWNLNITQLEMLNVLILLRTFGAMWVNQAIHVHIDNQAVVYALKHGRIKDEFMQAVARSIWLIAAAKDIQITCSHIAGSSNSKADILSRLFENRGSVNLDLVGQCTWWPVHGKYFYPNNFI